MTKPKTFEIKKDNIGNAEALDIIKARREEQTKLYLDKYHREHRERNCAACGREFLRGEIKQYYFGEQFHARCVIKMRDGEKP